MGNYAILADALCYPKPGKLDQLERSLSDLPSGSIKQAFERFLHGIRSLDLGAWEELHTRTLDLNPPAAPYIGYQIWGDSYQRGSFLSMMSRALETHQVDAEGELPDHLIPVLRLIDRLEEPFSELQEVLDKAIARIRDGLLNADPDNPYIALIDAISLACKMETAPSRQWK